VQGSGFRVHGSGSMFQGSGIDEKGLAFRVYDKESLGFRVSGFENKILD
jgi:hypothetical protein